MRAFWQDERGTIEVSSWLALVVMVALGMIVGLTNLRNEITQQFGDVAQALETLDQSYSYTVNNVTSTYEDSTVFTPPVPNQSPAGIDIDIAASPDE